MRRIVALRPLAIPDELRLCPVPGLGIDERWHPDRNPCGLRASRTALAVAGVAIFQAPLAIGPSDIPGLRAMVVGFSFGERVAEELNDTPWRPPALRGLPGRDTLHREMPVNGLRTPLLLHTPAIDLPDHLGFRLVDHEVLGGGRRLIATIVKPLALAMGI